MPTTRFPATAAMRAGLIAVLLFALSSLCCVRARAAAPPPPVQVEITGDLTETHRRNIRSHLSLVRAADRTTLSTALFNRLYGNATRETARALEPYGFYAPVITLAKRQQTRDWLLRLQVDPGRPVVI